MKALVVGALAAVVLLLTGVTVAQRLLSDEGEAVEPISADAAYAIDGPLTCDSEVNQVPSLPLEAEPTALLICADPDGSMPWTSPDDLVEVDLTALVESLADLERAPDGDYACTMQAGPGYDLLLGFSRERYARIHGDTGGCGVVTTASGEWFGADGVLDAALALVEEQRSTATPPSRVQTADLRCDDLLGERGYALSLTGDPADLVRVVSCWQPNAPELGPWVEGRVPALEVRVLAHDLARNLTPDGDTGDLRCPGGLDHHYFQHLLGQTAWGDVVMLAGECRRFYVVDLRPDGPPMLWHPSPASQRILDGLRR